jgi:hypothetical protein
MSALGQKQTYALQQAMSALHSIATAKADGHFSRAGLLVRFSSCVGSEQPGVDRNDL